MLERFIYSHIARFLSERMVYPNDGDARFVWLCTYPIDVDAVERVTG
jgi:hypothetical protein